MRGLPRHVVLTKEGGDEILDQQVEIADLNAFSTRNRDLR
jgi:hypothetical protein